MNVYPFIEAEQAGRRNVKRACELLQVSRVGFYAHRAGASQRQRDDAVLTARIRAVHEESKGRYGAPMIHAELARQGRRHGRKRVARLMRTVGLRGRTPKRWKRTTIPDPAAAARADLIRRDFTTDASKLNSRWCGDITYIRTWEGWLFLATVIDIASRRVVGFAIADHLRTELVAGALTNAIAARNPAWYGWELRGTANENELPRTTANYSPSPDGIGKSPLTGRRRRRIGAGLDEYPAGDYAGETLDWWSLGCPQWGSEARYSPSFT